MRGFVLGVFISLLFISCSKEIDFNIPNNTDLPVATSVVNVLKRAQQFSRISWTPIYDIPNNLGAYSAGITVTGIPYSSVKELDKFVGLDVSLKTFMTAVHNPRSVLYTENVGKSPYKGTNSAAYYGTVCSAAIDYAFGFNVNYTTSMLDTLSFFHKVAVQQPDSIQICDVLLSRGHEVMVYDIMRNERDLTIESVSIFESAGITTTIHRYDYNSFKNRWINDRWVIYRYNFARPVLYYPSPFVSINGESCPQYKYNDIICPSRGDFAVYREGEQVIINILNKNYTELTLYRNHQYVERRLATSDDEIYEGLTYGQYSIIGMDKKGNKSDEIHFEIVDTNVAAEVVGDNIRVHYKSNQGVPTYISLCDEVGNRYMILELAKVDIQRGEAFIKSPSGIKQCYCKVFFSTENGTATNVPIKITR